MKNEIKSFRYHRETGGYSYWSRRNTDSHWFTRGSGTSMPLEAVLEYIREGERIDMIEYFPMTESALDEQSKYTNQHTTKENQVNDAQKAATNEIEKIKTTTYQQQTSLGEINLCIKTIADRGIDFTVDQRRVLHKAFATIVPPLK